MASSFMADIGALGAEAITAKKSTSRANNTEMKMDDFLKLMVVQLQSQTIDDTADTGEMLNQLVQMQMVTALSNMTDASVMSYASSLVGKEVTIGYTDKENKFHQEVLNVIGTGLYNGQQVIFCDDGKMYQLNQIMGVGRIPELDKAEDEEKDPEQAESEEEANKRIDDLVASIQNGTFVDGSAGGEMDFAEASATEIGAVNGADTENSAESSTETAGDGTVDPLQSGLLDGMLANPNPTDAVYTGEQGAPADED